VKNAGGRRGSGRNGKVGSDGGGLRKAARRGSNKAFVIENGSDWLDVQHHAGKCWAWVITGRIHENFFGNTCDRPGCYERFQPTRRSPLQRFCSHECRRALERVLDRERRWRERGQDRIVGARNFTARSASLRL
jgi:hypothetical protein